MLTVAVPGGGELEPGFAVNVAQRPKFKVSEADGLVLITSQTAVADPLTTGISARLVVVTVPLTVVVLETTGAELNESGAVSLRTNCAKLVVVTVPAGAVGVPVKLFEMLVVDTNRRTP